MVDFPNQAGAMCNWPEIKVMEGARECLEYLSKNARCHLATNAENSNKQDIRQALERANISRYIEEIFCTSSIGHSKPEPEYFQFILSTLNVPKTDIVLIGDSLEKDIDGALQAGIDAIWFNSLRLPVPKGFIAINQLAELANTAFNR